VYRKERINSKRYNVKVNDQFDRVFYSSFLWFNEIVQIEDSLSEAINQMVQWIFVKWWNTEVPLKEIIK